ncbi:hypothetical protein [Bacillus piscicola]|uniref:hypothetical protein n=1 Tax=Bacillus piscicola TaxID=1632684 RepID=UPI001F092241|nr:hypothetical protein [Bacillus piscicola]
MSKKKQTMDTSEKVAPTMDEEDSYGRDATQEEIKNGESTKVIRLSLDENEPS